MFTCIHAFGKLDSKFEVEFRLQCIDIYDDNLRCNNIKDALNVVILFHSVLILAVFKLIWILIYYLEEMHSGFSIEMNNL